METKQDHQQKCTLIFKSKSKLLLSIGICCLLAGLAISASLTNELFISMNCPEVLAELVDIQECNERGTRKTKKRIIVKIDASTYTLRTLGVHCNEFRDEKYITVFRCGNSIEYITIFEKLTPLAPLILSVLGAYIIIKS